MMLIKSLQRGMISFLARMTWIKFNRTTKNGLIGWGDHSAGFNIISQPFSYTLVSLSIYRVINLDIAVL